MKIAMEISKVEIGFEENNNDLLTAGVLAVGMEFDSHDQLYTTITKHKYTNHVDLYKRSSRGLKAA